MNWIRSGPLRIKIFIIEPSINALPTLSINIQPQPIIQQNVNPYPQNVNPYPQNVNPYPQNINPYPQNVNPYPQNANPYPQNANPYPQNVNPYPQNINPYPQNVNSQQNFNVNQTYPVQPYVMEYPNQSIPNMPPPYPTNNGTEKNESEKNFPSAPP